MSGVKLRGAMCRGCYSRPPCTEANYKLSNSLQLLYTLPFHSRTPALYNELDKAGAVWGQRMGWEVPLWFASEGQGV